MIFFNNKIAFAYISAKAILFRVRLVNLLSVCLSVLGNIVFNKPQDFIAKSVLAVFAEKDLDMVRCLSDFFRECVADFLILHCILPFKWIIFLVK